MKKNVILLVASTFVALILGELLVRLTYQELPIENWGTAAFCRNNIVGRMMKPRVRVSQFSEDFANIPIVSNTKGYRDTEWEIKVGKKTVMLLGDSYGWGWGVPFEKTIGAHIAPEAFSVYNLCIPGDNLARMYRRYTLYHEAIRPGIIVILNYVNDFFDPAYQRAQMEAVRNDSTLVFRPDFECDRRYAKTFRDYLNESYIYRLVNRTRVLGGITFSSEQREKQAISRGFKQDADFLQDPDGAMEESLRLYREMLREMKTRYPVVVVLIPPSYQVSKAKYDQLNDVLDLDQLNLDAFEDRLRHLCARENIPFVSLTALLKQEEKQQSTYFARDAHLNTHGHEVAGWYLYRFLVEHFGEGREDPILRHVDN